MHMMESRQLARVVPGKAGMWTAWCRGAHLALGVGMLVVSFMNSGHS